MLMLIIFYIILIYQYFYMSIFNYNKIILKKFVITTYTKNFENH